MSQKLPKIMRAWDSGNSQISYVYRDKETGNKKIGKTKFHWWFYVLTSDWNQFKGTLSNFIEDGIINKTEDEGKYTRIYVDRKHNNEFLNKQLEMVWEYNNWNYNKLLNALNLLDIQTFEADILPYKRWMLQENVEVENEYKVLLYDIETDDRPHKIEVGKERIVSFAVKDATTGVQKFHILKEFTDDSEKELMKILASYFNSYDVVVSFNGSQFDDPYVRARFARYSIVIDYRKFLTQDHLHVFKVYGPKLSNYRLDTIGEEVCEINKIEHSESIYEMWKNNKKLLKQYNLRDVEIMFEVEKKTGFLAVARDVNVIGKCFVDDIFITRKVDNMIVAQAQIDKHYHFKTKVKTDENDEEKEKFKGAYVFEPIPGLYSDVNVLDFSSLYPNVIKTFNLSPDTLITPDLEDLIPPEIRITSVTGAQYRKDFIGIIPKVIMQMKEKRDYYKDLMANYDKGSMEHEIYDRLQYVYKSFGLSFYGAIGETHSRFYDVKVAESVTQGGVYFNKLCSKKCEKMNISTIYGDSVTSDRCTVIKIDEEINIVMFEELFKMTDVKVKERGKEFGIFSNPVMTLTYNFKTKQSEWKPIKTVIRHKTNKQIYGYRTRYGMSKLTADHSLIDSSGTCFKPTERFDSFHIPILKNEKFETIDLFKYVSGYTYSRKRGKDVSIVADDDYIYLNNGRKKCIKIIRYINNETDLFRWLKLIAHYICNGSTSTMETSTRFIATISSNNTCLLNELKETLDMFFIDGSHNILLGSKQTYRISMPTATHSIFWKQLAGQTCFGKFIPSFVFNLPEKYKKYFLNELINGDGSHIEIKSGHKIEFETGSTKLASGINYIANEIGYTCGLKWNMVDNTYTLRTHINENYGNHLLKNRCEKIDYDGYVYDLSVEDNHNFVDAMGNLLLHNTDSIFLDGLKQKNVDKVTDILAKLCKRHAIEKYTCDECTLKMEYDKGFKRIIVIAKKRYAGLITYLDGHFLKEPKLYVAGLEYKRTDWCKFAREKQYELIVWLLQDKLPNVLDVKNWILEQKQKIFTHKVTKDELVKSQKITKPLEEYIGRRLNVITAHQMLKDGKEVYIGDKVVFFIRNVNTKNQPMPEPDYKWDGRYCETHYWNKMIYPCFQRVLEAVYKNVNWENYRVSGTKMNQKVGRTLLW